MAFYTTTQDLQLPDDDYLSDWDSWHVDLHDEDKEPWHAAYECLNKLAGRVNFKSNPAILDRILHMIEYITNHTDSYTDTWQELHRVFPNLLNGVRGLHIDAEGLDIIKIFEKRDRARKKGKFSFFPHETCKTGQGFAKQHAKWLYAVSKELDLPEEAKYFTVFVNQSLKTAEFIHKQTLCNVSEAKNRQLPEGAKSVDLVKIDRYRKKQDSDLKAEYCAEAMQIYQQHGGIAEFITITLPKKARHDLDQAANILRIIINRTQGEGQALKHGIGAMWTLEAHKSHTPHMHVMIGFPGSEARNWFHQRLRKFYIENVRKLERFSFEFKVPYNAIVTKPLPTEGDIVRTSKYCVKNLDNPFSCLASGRKVSMFGTLYQGGFFEAESDRIVRIPSLTSFANSSSFHREDTGVNTYSLDNQVNAEPAQVPEAISAQTPAPATVPVKRFLFNSVYTKNKFASQSEPNLSFQKESNPVKKRPYAAPRPVPAATATNPPAKFFTAKPQETPQQRLAREVAAKFLTPIPRRKHFSFHPKKTE